MGAYVGHNAMRPIVPVIVNHGLRSGSTYALIDTGANVCAVSEKLVNELNMTTENLTLNLGTFDSTKVVEKPIASFTIENLDRSLKLPVDNALVSALLTTESESIMTNEIIMISHSNCIEVSLYISGYVRLCRSFTRCSHHIASVNKKQCY